MNNNLKMSLQEFATAVSQEMAIDKKNVSAFIDEFQKLIESIDMKSCSKDEIDS